jgi:hypothetical protein
MDCLNLFFFQLKYKPNSYVQLLLSRIENMKTFQINLVYPDQQLIYHDCAMLILISQFY